MPVATKSFTSAEMSPIDALWTLFKSQPKAVRKAFTERILMNEVQAKKIRQQIEVKQSLQRAFQELDEATATEQELPDAKRLFQIE